MDLARAREEYLSYLTVERGSSLNTIESYGRDLTRYITYLAEQDIHNPDDVTRNIVEAHIAALRDVALRHLLWNEPVCN